MKDLLDWSIFFEKWGYKVGLILIGLPFFYDVLFHGLLSDIAISKWGVLCQAIGWIIIVISRICKSMWLNR